MWDFLDEQAAPFTAAAARRYGRAVLRAGTGDAGPDDRESVGCRLLQLVFGTDGGQEMPPLVADLVGDPDDQEALAEVTARADEVFQSDPGKAEVAAAVIAEFCRAEANAGRVQALVDLGDLLDWDDPEAAQAAYQEAVDAGHVRALPGLAKFLIRVNGERAPRWPLTGRRSAAAILTSPPRRCIRSRWCTSGAVSQTLRGPCLSR